MPKILIISDVDGTVNGHGLALGVDNNGRIEYRYKLYDQHIGLVNKLMNDLKEKVSLEFISNGVTGAEINRAVCEQYFRKNYHLCHTLDERKETLQRIIDKHNVEMIFVLSDVSDEYLLLDNNKKIVFITDEENWKIVGQYEVKEYTDVGIMTTDFTKGNVLLKLLIWIKHNNKVEDGFFKIIK